LAQPPPPPPPHPRHPRPPPRRHSHQRRRRPVRPWRPRAPAGSGELVQRGNRARSGVGARCKWEWRQLSGRRLGPAGSAFCLPVRSGELVLGGHVQPVRRRRRRHVLHEPNAADPVTTGAALSGRPQPQVPQSGRPQPGDCVLAEMWQLRGRPAKPVLSSVAHRLRVRVLSMLRVLRVLQRSMTNLRMPSSRIAMHSELKLGACRTKHSTP
jgi:hypothetical protein